MIIDLDFIRGKIKLYRSLIAIESCPSSGRPLSGKEILGIYGVHAGFITQKQAAAVFVPRICGKGTIVAAGYVISGLFNIICAVHTAFPSVTFTAAQPFRHVSLINLLGFHGTDTDRHFTRKIIDDINIVGSFLQKQTVGNGFIPVPVMKIDETVGHIVERLHLLHLTDDTGIYNFLNLLHHSGNPQRKGNHNRGFRLFCQPFQNRSFFPAHRYRFFQE